MVGFTQWPERDAGVAFRPGFQSACPIGTGPTLDCAVVGSITRLIGMISGRWKSAHLRMLADDVFAGGEIDAEQFIVRNIALNPLDIRAKLAQNLIGFDGGFFQLALVEAARLRNIPLDEKSTAETCPSPIAPRGFLRGTVLPQGSASELSDRRLFTLNESAERDDE